MILRVVLPAALAFVVAVSLTGLFRRYALKRGLLDVPNARSSHEVPTPRGGGVAIVLAMLVALPALAALHVFDWHLAAGLMSAGVLAAGIGYADDRGQVRVGYRLLFQFAAAAVVVSCVGIQPVLDALPVLGRVPVICTVLTLLYLVWMLNLTNFMDGIDGIASVEVITVCIGTAICVALVPRASGWLTGGLAGGVGITPRESAIAFSLTFAAATAGFLQWNWPPARIFMGDAGSGFLGVLLGALTLFAGVVSVPLLWSCTILGGVFVVDATITLLRRIAHHETFYHAHRTHAYQQAARRFGHERVTIGVAVLNFCWLLPWAVLAARGSLYGGVAITLAYIPLVAMALYFRAGLRD